MSVIIVGTQTPLRVIASITGEMGLVPMSDGGVLGLQHDGKLSERIEAEKVNEGAIDKTTMRHDDQGWYSIVSVQRWHAMFLW